MLLSQSEKVNKIIKIDGKVYFSQKMCRIMAGPCAVESRDQIMFTAEKLSEMGITIFRAGSFKPRTDPYAFQGSGEKGLSWLEEVRTQFGMKIITETSDMTNFKQVEQSADIIQIGAKAMYNHALLKSAGCSQKPVLLKRHFSATVSELMKMSDYVLKEGNYQLMLCERGIRTFETSTRFTLDLCGAATIKKESRMPLVLDPSHAMGYAYGIPDIARACVAFGCEGLLIEVHHNPCEARCDRDQALDLVQFRELYQSLKVIGQAIGIEVV